MNTQGLKEEQLQEWAKFEAREKLIAAAPDLLEALKPLANLDLTGVNGDIIYQRNETTITKEDVIKAIAAIKKATV